MSMTRNGPACAKCGPVEEYYKAGRLNCPVGREEQRGDRSLRKGSWHRGAKYGLTKEEVAALPAVCEICQVEPANNIDHCHTSGKVRGHLCRGCNLGLGHFKDDIYRMRSAINYLERQ